MRGYGVRFFPGDVMFKPECMIQAQLYFYSVEVQNFFRNSKIFSVILQIETYLIKYMLFFSLTYKVISLLQLK